MSKVKKTKSIIQFIVLLSIGVLFIWLSVRAITDDQKEKIIDAFKQADYFWIVVSLLISWFSHFLRAYRWNYLLKPTGHKINLVNANCYVMIGYLANYGIPRMGEVSRCTLAPKYDNTPFEVAFGTVITERIIDFILFLVIFALTLLIQFNELSFLVNKYIFDPLMNWLSRLTESPTQLIIFGVVLIGAFVAFFLLRKKFSSLLKGKLGTIIKGMGQGLSSIAKTDKPFQFIFLSLSIWACYFYSLYVCFFALEGTSRLGQSECLTLLLFGTFGVIFAPGGLGAYPAIISWILFNTYGVDEISSFALPWLAWTSQFALILVLGLISLVILPLYNRNKNVVSSTIKK
ncbi:lysylphosphatidylglycerol synthase transmembrane domain-containing protein [Sediminibacterium sp.]|uniref:lysylphosphatidylglycerol synthase transmembrane domain-containing protein n=1 Tax=Sediminibacterium sp. TaxID=1917865 RepID=UPI0027329338|nr:lysylphosphatidylglycerol synthase transmembrane domain-containing protein [Sediminibacterium sp.]MDP3567462.1 lysylphosphatidylglycerol synthase transmembrane domain-containing protein [Sediminibacterium sp.]